ncbi:flagellar biosynthetic protein FliO [Photorhabdus temperata]|uniref:Flagellar protein n=2 Tax=Photorhabdus TaxID=29487 RepID=A0A7X5TM19_9GAMM|nr:MULTISPECIES: flagellar biosynthetic protein FliO [Photorhabdus]ETS30177.1 flagellar biosynthetic protein FliO [Photorhabdus khanii NC19]NHB96527.1 flagellar biosynthetic protein FliO [Photorhabdus stackebrandtii]OHV55557.1 flagellar biosynthetic protein FliO [Photorhabdus temperata]
MAFQPSLHHGAAEPVAQTQAVAQVATSAPIPAGQTLMQISSALAGVLLLIFTLTWLIRRMGLVSGKGKTQQQLSIKASCSLGQRERVVIVEVENDWLVLGVTAQQINLLHQMPIPESNGDNPEGHPIKPALFGQILKNTLMRQGKADEKK